MNLYNFQLSNLCSGLNYWCVFDGGELIREMHLFDNPMFRLGILFDRILLKGALNLDIMIYRMKALSPQIQDFDKPLLFLFNVCIIESIIQGNLGAI